MLSVVKTPEGAEIKSPPPLVETRVKDKQMGFMEAEKPLVIDLDEGKTSKGKRELNAPAA